MLTITALNKAKETLDKYNKLRRIKLTPPSMFSHAVVTMFYIRQGPGNDRDQVSFPCPIEIFHKQLEIEIENCAKELVNFGVTLEEGNKS